MMNRHLVHWLALLVALLGLACDDGAPPIRQAGGGPASSEAAEEGGPPSSAPPSYLEPPINIPTPYRPPRQSTDTTADTGMQAGGRGAPSRRGERFAANFEGLSAGQIDGLLDRARANAQEADPDDGCGRLYAGFQVFMEEDEEGPMMSEAQFLRYCERMSPEMKTCFEDPSARSESENARCAQMIGTEDVFGDQPWGQPTVPANRRPNREQLQKARSLQRRAQRAARMD